MATIKIPGVENFSEIQVDAAAKALREDYVSGKMHNEWENLPTSTKKKWWRSAAIALSATNKIHQSE